MRVLWLSRCAISYRNYGTVKSTRRWLKEHTSDPFVRMRDDLNFRSRSAFKLLEMAQKYRLFMDGDTVIELGAAPGGWTQVCIFIIRIVCPLVKGVVRILENRFVEVGERR